MHRLHWALVVPTLALAIGVRSMRAQDMPAGQLTGVQPVASMGQPPVWQFHAAASGLFGFTGDGSGGSLVLGAHRSVSNPVMGLLGGTGEMYGTGGGAFRGLGARLLATSRFFGLSAGADWNLHARRVDFMLSYQTAVLRGGLLGHGTMLRADWLPTRNRTLGLGVQAPLGQPFAGRTRPRATCVPFPRTGDGRELATGWLDATTEAALASVASAASLLRAYSSVATDEEVRMLAAGQGYGDAMHRYGDALVSAFTSSARDTSVGAMIAKRARAGLLSDVLLPYNTLFGQVKDQANIGALTSRAHATFARWLEDSTRLAPTARPAVLRAHARWLGIIEQVHASLRDEWKDSRSVWLPLQLALAPEQYDEQTETDSLLGRMIGRPFTDQNALTLLRSADLPLEIARSIYAARSYHVLWTHNVAGHALETGEVDNVSYSMVADAYLPALTAAVQRYDSTGRMPVYMILIDEFFYEMSDGRLWMTMLENPLAASMRLPGDNAEREAHLRQRQQELRAAVAASTRLQAEARRAGGDDWLRRVVKVHVSITQPADFSFRSQRIVPPIPFTPDNIVRDHRKLVFYDLDESDPYRGALMLMGIGIGEHFASTSWEDRGYRLRGPAALEARSGLRRLLHGNGLSDDDIPMPLREVTSALGAERRANAGDYVGRALQVHNEVGFGPKQSSVSRAMLYNLAQPGSVIIVPDPLWLSREWAAMLAGAAARGARVYVIAPALANAPSPEASVMALAHDAMLRLLEVRDRLGDRLSRAGGELRVGLFAAHAQVNDAAGVQREVRDGLRRAPWIRDVIPFDAQALAVLDRAEMRAAADGKDATALTRVAPRPPQLHQKTQLIARPGAIAALVRQPGWEEILARAMQTQSQQTTRFAEQLGYTTPDLETEAARRTDTLLRGYEQAIPEAERKQISFYFALGTQNQDARGMMLDGEATLLVSGFYAASGLVDLHDLMARSTWIETPSELDALLPPRSAFMQRLANWLRVAF
ncbi:MAG: hypothetical protein ACJ8AD_18945 [Gemmatimonadaceae bacterium]